MLWTIDSSKGKVSIAQHTVTFRRIFDALVAARDYKRLLGPLFCTEQLNINTGARDKAGSNDASAEYVAEMRQIFDKAKVLWQTGELGKGRINVHELDESGDPGTATEAIGRPHD